MEQTWTWMGDRAIVRSVGSNAEALALWRALSQARLGSEVLDVIPAALSVTIVLQPGAEPGARLLESLRAPVAPSVVEGARHTIEVTYDGEDIDEVARAHDMTRDDVATMHADATYHVAFVGFQPGFAYLNGLPDQLHTPRRATPRTRIPAGAVAIGGAYTGIYPSASPGGWSLIGHADVALFDAERGSLLRPGDRVRFVPR